MFFWFIFVLFLLFICILCVCEGPLCNSLCIVGDACTAGDAYLVAEPISFLLKFTRFHQLLFDILICLMNQFKIFQHRQTTEKDWNAILAQTLKFFQNSLVIYCLECIFTECACNNQFLKSQKKYLKLITKNLIYYEKCNFVIMFIEL